MFFEPSREIAEVELDDCDKNVKRSEHSIWPIHLFGTVDVMKYSAVCTVDTASPSSNYTARNCEKDI